MKLLNGIDTKERKVVFGDYNGKFLFICDFSAMQRLTASRSDGLFTPDEFVTKHDIFEFLNDQTNKDILLVLESGIMSFKIQNLQAVIDSAYKNNILIRHRKTDITARYQYYPARIEHIVNEAKKRGIWLDVEDNTNPWTKKPGKNITKTDNQDAVVGLLIFLTTPTTHTLLTLPNKELKFFREIEKNMQVQDRREEHVYSKPLLKALKIIKKARDLDADLHAAACSGASYCGVIQSLLLQASMYIDNGFGRDAFLAHFSGNFRDRIHADVFHNRIIPIFQHVTGTIDKKEAKERWMTLRVGDETRKQVWKIVNKLTKWVWSMSQTPELKGVYEKVVRPHWNSYVNEQIVQYQHIKKLQRKESE